LKRGLEPSFLEKLAFAYRADQPIDEWPAQGAAAEELDLVMANLLNVLRTRKRHGSVLDDFGLGDHDDPRCVDDAIDVLGAEIQKVASRYEPRLRSPRVLAVSRDQSRRIHYHLSGALSGASVKILVVFDTSFRTVVSVARA
jgi:predicted component of type VI protein secretion system